MILAIETIILCIIFFLLCFGGTGTDDKNLKSYSSYPDKVQNQIKEIIEFSTIPASIFHIRIVY